MMTMNKITLKSAMFFILFAVAFTSCKEDEDKDIPVISLSGANPLTHDTINTPYVEPGVSTSEGSLVSDLSAVNLSKRGEYTIYYSAVDGADNIGHATRKLIVRNPADQIEGNYNVEVIDISSGNTLDQYVDDIIANDYINGKFTFSNFDGVCGLDEALTGSYNWNDKNVDIAPQTYNSQPTSNNTGAAFGVNINGSNVNFQMDITSGGATKRYIYRKRNTGDPTTSIMAVHISPDAPGVDILVDNQKVNVATLSYSNNTSYVTADAGNRSIKVNLAGSCTSVIGSISNYDANKYYSVFAVDVVAALDVIKLEDDLSNTSIPTNARVRFLHAVPGAPNVDIAVAGGGPVVFTNVGFKQSNTTEVAAGSYSLSAFETGTSNLITTTGNITFENGRVYTLYAYPQAGGGVGVRVITNR